MDHFQRIYTSQAAEYHAMIAAEDVDGHLLAALREVTPLAGKRILDLGTGTGRLPLLLAGEARSVIGLDLHTDMLRQQQMQRHHVGGRWELVQGDIRWLPFPTACADIVTAGWAIGHMRNWFADDWQREIGQALDEMHRVVVPGGAIIIMETLTTGGNVPAPPNQQLAEYYLWLEEHWDFRRQTISTDYNFGSVEEAVARTSFFFGDEMAAHIRANHWARLPEWTGVWSKRVATD